MKVPIEAWPLILNHFDDDSLKKCLLISKQFRELVITTPQLMKKLSVIFLSENWREKIPFVEQHGLHVKSMKFQDVTLTDTNEIKKVLRLTPNVEELVFERVVTGESNGERAEEPTRVLQLELKKLTKLKIECEEDAVKDLVGILKGCETLKALKICVYFINEQTYIGDFISQQDSLEKLNIGGCTNSNVFLKSIFTSQFDERANFKLETLSINCSLRFDQNFSKFLLAQALYLKQLKVFSYSMDFHFFRLILNNFHKQTKLICHVGGLFDEVRLNSIKNLRLPNILELDIDECCQDTEDFMTIVQIFPNVELLVVNMLFFSLYGILEKLPKLKKLTATYSRIELLMMAKSSSLKELELENLSPMTINYCWNKFAKNCPSIERLTLKHFKANERFKTLNDDVKIILESLLMFKKLKFCELMNETFQTYDVPNDDADQIERIPIQIVPNFRFILEIPSKGAATLSVTSYFEEVHGESLQRIIDHYKVGTVLQINSF